MIEQGFLHELLLWAVIPRLGGNIEHYLLRDIRRVLTIHHSTFQRRLPRGSVDLACETAPSWPLCVPAEGQTMGPHSVIVTTRGQAFRRFSRQGKGAHW